MLKIQTVDPRQCHLYSENVSIGEASKALMHIIKEYPETRQLDADECMRSLLKCPDCGQLYFYEFLEWIDWKNGNDPQYRKFIPVESYKDADTLNLLDAWEITRIRPQLCVDWPDDEPQSIRWLIN